MEITLKLFATLSDYLPFELNGRVRVDNQLPLEVADGTTVQAVIDQMHLPSKMTHLVLVNGVYVTAVARDAPVALGRRTGRLASHRGRVGARAQGV